jgi:hypothetical protein
MTRRRRRSLVAALLLGTGMQWTVAVPVQATEVVQAVSGCARHCRQVRSLAAASRCCGVSDHAREPARLVAPGTTERSAESLVAVLPPSARLIGAPGATLRVRAPAHGDATGPPALLRTQILLL